jgi:thiol-disulfide isomerase/thioredoxin
MKKTVSILIGLIVVAAIVIIAVTAGDKANTEPAENEVFAQCIADSGATFFGAFWCPHCINQKEMFGRKAAKLLPYQECSTANRDQNELCKEAGIQSYPTWEFADGSRISGEQTFFELAEKTNCPLPGNIVNDTINDALEAAQSIEENSSSTITTE